MFARCLPLAELALFVLIGVVWRGWLQYRRYGHAGIVLFQSSGLLRQTRDAIFFLLFVGVVVQSAVFAVSPGSLRGMSIAMPQWTAWAGAIVMPAGLALVVAAQLGMGGSWRIGIDVDASPGLVTSGLYQFCRNPIYLGMIACLVGLTLMLASWLSVALAAGVVWCIRSQTIAEEAYLERTYGDAFQRYAARVGRFWPGLGKLPCKLSAATEGNRP